MAEKTVLAMPGRTITVARPVKHVAQIAMALTLTAFVTFVAIFIATAYTPRGGFMQTYAQWLVILNRPDIQATAVLTAIVSILLAYWQRGQERR
jgi:hypothetical protein